MRLAPTLPLLGLLLAAPLAAGSLLSLLGGQEAVQESPTIPLALTPELSGAAPGSPTHPLLVFHPAAGESAGVVDSCTRALPLVEDLRISMDPCPLPVVAPKAGAGQDAKPVSLDLAVTTTLKHYQVHALFSHEAHP
jgi:hypothetical protein